MKAAKKILAAFCAAALCFTALAVTSLAAPAQTKLQYGADGKFKILTFTDTHLTAEDQSKMITFLGEAIDFVKPDLVVFDGDNVYGSACETEATERAAITLLLGPLVARGQKFALVFGNHDPEYKAGTKEDLMAMYQEIGAGLCLAIDEGAEIYGCGNYNLPVYASTDADKVVSNLYFIDSGSDTEGVPGYDYVRASQFNWAKETSDALKAQNGGEAVPSLLFQHIIVPEIYDYYYTPSFELPFALPKFDTYLGKVRSPFPDFLKINGLVMEPSCPSYFSEGEFDSIAAQGDVMAMIFGHDHVNYFTANMKGVNLEQISGTTFGGSYGADAIRGATVFTLDESNPWSYQKELITYWQLALRPGSQIGNPIYPNGSGFFQTIPYALEILLQALLTPVKWLAAAL